jgi:hypothetical protein
MKRDISPSHLVSDGMGGTVGIEKLAQLVKLG